MNYFSEKVAGKKIGLLLQSIPRPKSHSAKKRADNSHNQEELRHKRKSTH